MGFLGKIPIDPHLARCCDQGLNFFEEYPSSPAVRSLQSIIEQIRHQVEGTPTCNDPPPELLLGLPVPILLEASGLLRHPPTAEVVEVHALGVLPAIGMLLILDWKPSFLEIK